MSQMRKDVFTGRWVIVGETDTVQASDFRFKPFVRDTAFCPFCETHEASTPPEVFAIRRAGSTANGPGWSVRVVPNYRPRLRIEGELGRRGEGFHDLMNGVGAHEIIAETPRHDRSLTWRSARPSSAPFDEVDLRIVSVLAAILSEMVRLRAAERPEPARKGPLAARIVNRMEEIFSWTIRVLF